MRGALVALLIALVGGVCLAQPPAKKPAQKSRPRRARSRLASGPRDALPPGAIRRLGSTAYRGNSSDADTQLVFYDAKTIRTVGRHRIATCDIDTGAYTGQYVKPGEAISLHQMMIEPGFALAGDGSTAAFAAWEPIIAVYDAQTAEKLHEFHVRDMAYPVALASDGSLLAYAEVPEGASRWNWKPEEAKSKEFSVVVLQVATAKELLRVKVAPASITQLAFSPDKRKLLICAGAVGVWDITARKELGRFDAPGSFSITDAAVSPDGRILAAGATTSKSPPDSDGLILAWNIDTRKELWRGEEPKYGIAALAFSPDGKRLASGGSRFIPQSGVLRVWDAISGKPLTKIENKSASFANCLAFDRSGKFLASTGSDQNIHIWDASTGTELHPRQGHRGKVNGLAFCVRGRFVLSVSEADGTVRVWDVASGRQMHSFQAEECPLMDGAVSRDGKMAATCGDRVVIFWDMATGKQLRKVSLPPPKPGLARCLGGLDFSRDGSVFRGFSIELPQVEVLGARRDERETHTVPLAWEVRTGKALPQGQGGNYVGAAISPNGKMTISQTGSVFDTASGIELFKLYEEGPNSMGYNGEQVSFSDDSRMIAGQSMLQGSGGIVDRVWEVLTGGVVRTVEGNHQAKSLAFSPDSRVVAGRATFDVKLWDTVSDEVVQVLRDPGCSSLAFAPDGRTLASGQDDGTIILWRIDPGRWQHGDVDALAAKGLEAKWADLAAADAHVGQLGVRALVESPVEAVPFLKERMKPAGTVDAAKIRRLVSEMDSSTFSVRDKAFQELRKLGTSAEPALREFLSKNPSTEAAERARSLLRDLVRVRSPDELRRLRGIQVLETIASEEARAVLQTLAASAATPRERQDATASLERLSERVLVSPAPTRLRAEDVEVARRIIDRALRAHGGAATLARLKAVSGEHTGKSYGRAPEPMEYTSEFASQPPDREWWSTRIKQKDGKEFRMITARDGDHDWSRIGNLKGSYPPESRAEVREHAYAEWIKMLYPLANRTIPLAPLPKCQVEGRPAVGVLVTGKGHKPIKLFFDEETGLLVKVETRGDDSLGGEATYEQIYLEYRTFDGVKCATRLKSLQDGKLADEAHVIRMKRTEKLDDKLFVEPK